MSSNKANFVKYITTNTGFLRNLYKLGVSARNKREAGFHLHLFPNKEYSPSEVRFGGPAHLPPAKSICVQVREKLKPSGAPEEGETAERRERDFEFLTTVLDIHCHSVLRRASWKDFFSSWDFDTMLNGVAMGLVIAPLDPPGMGMLMAQPKGPLAGLTRERVRGLHQEALMGFLEIFSFFREQGVRLSTGVWMGGATAALKLAGLAATAIAYRFPPECGEESFLSINTAAGALAGPGWKERRRGALGVFKAGTNLENDRLLRLMREEKEIMGANPAELRRSFGDACKSYQVLNDQRTGISPEEYFNAPEEEYQRTVELLSQKIQIAPWEAVELSRQIIKHLAVVDYLEFKVEDIADWKVKREDAERIEKMPLFGMMELVILMEVGERNILRLIKQGEIKPDFTVTSGDKTSYFFLEIPTALAKGKI